MAPGCLPGGNNAWFMNAPQPEAGGAALIHVQCALFAHG